MLVEKKERLKQDLKQAKQEYKALTPERKFSGREALMNTVSKAGIPKWGGLIINKRKIT